MTTPAELSPDLALALQLADEADGITLAYARRTDLRVETKADMSPVSEADQATELALRAGIQAARPDDAIVGEEYGGDAATGRRWILDPIDGTKNYVRRVPVWATLIALADDSGIPVGVVSAPALGRRWWAARGHGAWTTGPESPEPPSLDRILDAASGLTHHEAEGAMALSITRHGEIRPEVVFELKAQALRKANLLSLHRGPETFADLGGLEAVKGFCRQALRGGPVRPRGILLLGVPGTGKSFLAKALGNETGRPTLLLDLGSLMGSLVGQT